ncbi:peptidylprolyl isomerase/FKBP-type peptidyl-prolyl cis-trans isomerase FklB [Brevundimonas variabilis]|uniref:Peptidyl-prolyl cis-trans isomerase n=2 Tax=Brevundimonas variabilis TaxID=74312 RepID=A0A7W9CFS5_9CAUL|nr:peptidylprolyl isomerase/FKBP-type peptidyl-prolyl cis-trans isomerase FklB [Brevundimonas variabilis]
MRYGWVRTAAAAAMTLVLVACGGGEDAAAGGDAASNLAAAEAFLTKNATAEGIQTLPSGVQYKIIKSGPAGGAKPDGNDLVLVNYEGSLIDGTVFDSSFERGQPYATHLDQVVPGWTAALSQMKVGDEWMIYIPPALGYGEAGGGAKIPSNAALVFRVQLLDVANIPGAPRGGPTSTQV